MPIGMYDDIIFETSDRRILTFQGFTRNASANWHEHDRYLRKPAGEFLGPELDTVTFTVQLNASLGVNPQYEADRWLIKCRAGTVGTLMVGNKGYGVDKWRVDDVSQSFNTVYQNGKVYSIDVDVTLTEYVGVLR